MRSQFTYDIPTIYRKLSDIYLLSKKLIRYLIAGFSKFKQQEYLNAQTEDHWKQKPRQTVPCAPSLPLPIPAWG